jgi:hypothetical protein
MGHIWGWKAENSVPRCQKMQTCDFTVWLRYAIESTVSILVAHLVRNGAFHASNRKG